MDSDAAMSSGADRLVAQALVTARGAAVSWPAVPVAERLRVIRRARRLIARDCEALAGLLADRRPVAETLVAEVLPLAEAARFLERHAAGLLAPRKPLGGRPLWLLGVRAEIRREPLGAVLILAPSNYPLMLPGIQVLQALAAGNAVCVKPAPGCEAPMTRLAALLAQAGLPDGALTVLDTSVAVAQAAARAGFDRIVLTGSAQTGRQVLAAAAARLTPATMELSGNDAVFVLPGADLKLVSSCLAYGLRLNGGATCIAPRRVFIGQPQAAALETALLARIVGIAPVAVPDRVRTELSDLLRDARAAGARVIGAPSGERIPPVIVADAPADLRLLRQDVFAPVLAIVPVRDMDHALECAALCPYALGASVFGPVAPARALAARVNAGSVVVNDVIVPTADPRLPFGGRNESGFGVTRGAEGLLEMTAVKAISVRHGWFRPHLSPPGANDARRFAGMIRLLHG